MSKNGANNPWRNASTHKGKHNRWILIAGLSRLVRYGHEDPKGPGLCFWYASAQNPITTMKCLHCGVEIHDYFDENKQHVWEYPSEGDESPAGWWMSVTDCPACEGSLVQLWRVAGKKPGSNSKIEKFMAYPKFAVRPLPKEVQNPFRAEFLEACAVLPVSPKASAALSRRCLQGLLRAQGYSQRDLAPQIDAVIATNALPTYLRDAIDAVRNIGNFAAHPLKSQASGQIADVEPGEAEWTLDVLEGLFDFFIVQPAQLAAKTTALNAKLAALGKPPMK